MATSYTPQLQAEYKHLFDTCIIMPEKNVEINPVVDKMLAAKSRYEAVATKLGIPWHFIAIVHCMEGSLSFNKHLHNGDPLTARTVQVPAGRPKTGEPPFAWEVSAEDALIYDKINTWADWSVPGMLYKFEVYNGFGYRKLPQPINSPYLWSYSNQYTKGKYVKDGEYDPDAVSKQIGAAVILKRMAEKQIISLEDQFIPVPLSVSLTQIMQLGEVVRYDPDHKVTKALELQKLLNAQGAHLDEDSEAGNDTSKAYFNLTGSYLTGDPRKIP